jgi:ABC-type polysaccharide/polyol phosphate transport system ATPase subunit
VTTSVTVTDVSKRFRLYHERNQSLKASLMRGRRARYEEFWALQNVSLEVDEGETFGLIGENGSGKSTLLKIIARILRPDHGSVAVVGKMSALLELGAGFHPELSGRENVYLNGSILGLSKAELNRRFDDIVEFAGLERFIDTPVKNYSSGMYVRLGFSVAINVQPDVLLVDEVLAVGDEQFQRRCGEKFAELRHQGKTVVIVSHAMESVRTLCDRVAWLEHGHLQDIGPPSAIIDRYVGLAHEDREVDEAGQTRWGSGEARIERVELLDGSGAPASRVRTGDTVTVRFHYRANEAIPKAVFGMAIHTVDGQHVTGPNTRDGNCVPDQIEGEGHVDLQIPRLLLLPGTYDVTASIYDYSCLHPFDYRQGALRFDVDRSTPAESHGVVSLDGRWRIQPRAGDPTPVDGHVPR